MQKVLIGKLLRKNFPHVDMQKVLIGKLLRENFPHVDIPKVDTSCRLTREHLYKGESSNLRMFEV